MDNSTFIHTARQLVREHGLQDWAVQWSRSKRNAGHCNYTTKTLSFSPYVIPQFSDDKQRNTILHEIAHALTPGAGHGPVWQAKARAIGCDGKRTYDSKNVEYDYKYTLKCTGCGKVLGHRMKRTNMSSKLHRLCGKSVALTPYIGEKVGTFTQTPPLKRVQTHDEQIKIVERILAKRQPVMAQGQFARQTPKTCPKHFVELTPAGTCPLCD